MATAFMPRMINLEEVDHEIVLQAAEHYGHGEWGDLRRGVYFQRGRRAWTRVNSASFSLCAPLAAVRQGHSICFEIPVALRPDRRRAEPLRKAGLEMPQNVKRLWIVR